MLYSFWDHLLRYEGCVSCYRGAGITDMLISSYHRSAGSPPALGIWPTDNKSSRLAITLSHSALAAAQSWTLAFLPFSSPPFFLKPLSISAWSVTLYYSFVPASWSLPCHHFPKSFAYLSWNLNLYTTWKVKCGTMRLMLSGWVNHHNIWHCQMHYVQDISQVTPSFILFHFNQLSLPGFYAELVHGSKRCQNPTSLSSTVRIFYAQKT